MPVWQINQQFIKSLNENEKFLSVWLSALTK